MDLTNAHKPTCTYRRWVEAGRRGDLGPDSGQGIPPCDCDTQPSCSGLTGRLLSDYCGNCHHVVAAHKIGGICSICEVLGDLAEQATTLQPEPTPATDWEYAGIYADGQHRQIPPPHDGGPRWEPFAVTTRPTQQPNGYDYIVWMRRQAP